MVLKLLWFYGGKANLCVKQNESFKKVMKDIDQESRREGWTDAAIMLCKLNKSP